MFYYDVTVIGNSSSSSANTEAHMVRGVTNANQYPCTIMGLYMAPALGTLGGFRLRAQTWDTPPAAITTIVAQKRHPRSLAAQTDFATAGAGTTRRMRLTVGSTQMGSGGKWLALGRAHGITLQEGGGVNGNIAFSNIATTASVLYDWMTEFVEG